MSQVEESLSIEHPLEMSIKTIMSDFQKIDDEHCPFATIIFYTAFVFTVFTFLYVFLTRIFSKLLSKFMNISFKLKGATFKIYNLAALFIWFLSILLIILQMQSEQFKKNLKLDTPEKRLYRLKYKWLIEEQLWLMAMLLIEVVSLYRLSIMNDKRVSLENGISFEEKENARLISEENLPTQASDSIFES